MDYNRIVFKTISTPYTGLTTDALYEMERELKSCHAIRFECTTGADQFVPDHIAAIHRETTVLKYIAHMQYLYGEELQVVTNEEDGHDYYLMTSWNTAYPRRYRITWDTLERGRYHRHEYTGLLTAQNIKHARDRFRIWWNAKEQNRKPRPRYAFHVEVKPEQ